MTCPTEPKAGVPTTEIHGILAAHSAATWVASPARALHTRHPVRFVFQRAPPSVPHLAPFGTPYGTPPFRPSSRTQHLSSPPNGHQPTPAHTHRPTQQPAALHYYSTDNPALSAPFFMLHSGWCGHTTLTGPDHTYQGSSSCSVALLLYSNKESSNLNRAGSVPP